MTYRHKRPLKLFTHSSIGTLRKCPQKYRIEVELCLRADREPPPLRMGSSYHGGREHDTESLEVALASIVEGYSHVPDWCDTEEDRESWAAECVIVMEMYRGFRKHVSTTYEILATEVPFFIPIPGLKGVRNAGKIDKIVKLADGRTAVLEIKTAGEPIEPTADYWRKMRLDAQVSRYLVAARELSWPAETILYDVTRKPEIRPKNIPSKDIVEIMEGEGRYFGFDVEEHDVEHISKLNDEHRAQEEKAYFAENQDKDTMPKSKRKVPKIRETPGLFAIRVRHAIDEDPGRYYQTLEIPRLRKDIDDFHAKMLDDVKEVRFRRTFDVWQKNDQACTSMGRCPYLDLCSNHVDLEQETPPDGFVRLESPHPELGAA